MTSPAQPYEDPQTAAGFLAEIIGECRLPPIWENVPRQPYELPDLRRKLTHYRRMSGAPDKTTADFYRDMAERLAVVVDQLEMENV